MNRVTKCETLGFTRDGIAGAQYGTAKATMNLISLTTWLLTQDMVARKCLQIVAGRWCRQVQMRRELSVCLASLWDALGDKGYSHLIEITPRLRDDLFTLLCCIPLMVTDLRMRVDPVITVSDASEEGCGVCRSIHITKAGRKMLSSAETLSQQFDGEDIGVMCQRSYPFP